MTKNQLYQLLLKYGLKPDKMAESEDGEISAYFFGEDDKFTSISADPDGEGLSSIGIAFTDRNTHSMRVFEQTVFFEEE